MCDRDRVESYPLIHHNRASPRINDHPRSFINRVNCQRLEVGDKPDPVKLRLRQAHLNGATIKRNGYVGPKSSADRFNDLLHLSKISTVQINLH